jgi:hypothetical protein
MERQPEETDRSALKIQVLAHRLPDAAGRCVRRDKAVKAMRSVAWRCIAFSRYAGSMPEAQPHSGVVVDRSIRLVDGAYTEVVRQSAQGAVQRW